MSSEVSSAVSVPVEPDYIRRMDEDYGAKIAHTFILHGNVFDYPTNFAQQGDLLYVLSHRYDNHCMASTVENSKSKAEILNRKPARIAAYFTMNDGLQFFHEKSQKVWEDLMGQFVEGVPDNDRPPIRPINLEGTLQALNFWFRYSTRLYQSNLLADGKKKMEAVLTVVFMDADALFPCGEIAGLGGDRGAIVHLRNWARDEMVGHRNRLILVTRHLSDLHASIRGGDSCTSCVMVRYPNLEDREEWLACFDQSVKEMAQSEQPFRLGKREIRKIEYAEDMDQRTFAIQAAGMSRRRMAEVIMKSWSSAVPIDYVAIRSVKQRSVQEEFEGLVEFFEPESGFDQIGGHDHVKEYFLQEIIHPLRKGDRRACSRGALMTGPPGTGKTVLAKALAKEARMNFMIGNLGRLFGGIVGQTEAQTRKFFEAVDAAAPVIVFLDEIESVLSSGRVSAGDSGTSARVFNSVMTWLSDDSRVGRVVVVAATNRPDLLDAALIRQGRFDAILAVLPPATGDAKGRAQILNSLCKKHAVKFDPELSPTAKDSQIGLGKLYNDTRIWTGAEMETVLRKAFRKATFHNRKNIALDDWNQAMEAVLPSTQEVEAMIDLALLYANDLDYVPQEWRVQAGKKDNLRSNVAARVGSGILSSVDREI